MILKNIKDTFNPYIPMNAKDFGAKQGWIIFVVVLFSIPMFILQKQKNRIDEIMLMMHMLLAVIVYMEFIFTVKRYRALQIPIIWACVVFLMPFNIISFIVAASEDNILEGKWFKIFRNYIKEDKDELFI